MSSDSDLGRGYGALPLFGVYARHRGICLRIEPEDYEQAPRTFLSCLNCVLRNLASRQGDTTHIPVVTVGSSGRRPYAMVRVEALPEHFAEFVYRGEPQEFHERDWESQLAVERLMNRTN